jgi:hypothetical protein
MTKYGQKISCPEIISKIVGNPTYRTSRFDSVWRRVIPICHFCSSLLFCARLSFILEKIDRSDGVTNYCDIYAFGGDGKLLTIIVDQVVHNSQQRLSRVPCHVFTKFYKRYAVFWKKNLACGAFLKSFVQNKFRCKMFWCKKIFRLRCVFAQKRSNFLNIVQNVSWFERKIIWYISLTT